MNNKPRVLIIYSNPPDSPRIRLDKEHRRITLALKHQGIDESLVQRLHATSIEDLVILLQSNTFEIIQFSGHGDGQFIFLENTTHDLGVELSAENLAEIIKGISTKLRAAIFLSCYSADALPILAETAPYLISIFGPANDETSIEFIGKFYESFFHTDSIEQAFKNANLLLSAKNLKLKAVLSRRGEKDKENRILFQVIPQTGADSILIDLTKAKNDISKLGISLDDTITLLSRKIKIHRWIFESPTDQVVLSLGRYFGVFSWENAKDIVYCERIIRLNPEVEEKLCEVWAGLITRYNDHRVDKYRLAVNPADPTLVRYLKQAIDDYYILSDTYFNNKDNSEILRNCVPEQYLVSKSLIVKYLEICDIKFHRDDFSATVEYLETILSALHDLISALTSKISDFE